jgi:RNA polymerase sigma factor (sigma-70 family)
MTTEFTNEIDRLRASAKGNPDAFEPIVTKYQALICSITYGATYDFQKSEELAQETFLNAWKNLAKLKDLAKFKAWLCAIAKTIISNYNRGTQRDLISDAAPIKAAAGSPSTQQTPLDEVISKEDKALVSHALANIPEKYRQPLILFYRSDQSTKAVAVAMDITENAARQRLHRGRKMLKDQLTTTIETTLARTAPKKAFTTAVMASVTAITVKTTVAMASVSAGSTSAAGITAVLATTAAKIAAVVIVAIGITAAAITYNNISGSTDQPTSDVQAQPAQRSAQTARLAEPEPVETAVNTDEVVISQPKQPDSPVEVLPPEQPDTPVDTIVNAPPIKTEPEFDFKPKGILSGLITDAKTGQPVTDATIEIAVRRVYLAKTDKNGFYSFENVTEQGNYRVKIISNEYLGGGEQMVSLAKDKQTVKNFKLKPACMIEVKVVDEKGDPIESADLFASSYADEHGREVVDAPFVRKTGKDGILLLGGFPPSDTDYIITASHQVEKKDRPKSGIILIETLWDYAPDKLVVNLTDPNVIEYGEIVLKKGIEVKGYAGFNDGMPAEGFTVCAIPAWWHSSRGVERAAIDAEGNLTFKNILPGAYNIMANMPHGENSWLSSNILNTDLPTKDGELLILTFPGSSPKSSVSISGTIVFTGDKLPQTVEVSASSPKTGPASMTIHPSGEKDRQKAFKIDQLSPGKYTLRFYGTEIESQTINDVTAPTDDLNLEIAYSAMPHMKGVVTDVLTEKPVGMFKARVIKVKSLHSSRYVQPNKWFEFESKAGSFDIETVGPGVYQVQIVADGYASAWSEEMSSDENYGIEITLSKGGNIAGTVKDENGKLISDAMVIPLSSAGTLTSRGEYIFGSTDGSVKTQNGRFALDRIPAGIETLKVTHPKYAYAVVDNIEVTDGETTTGVNIVLSKGATVQGHVYDGNGKPVSNSMLYFQDKSGYSGTKDEEAGRFASVLTDRDGFYKVVGLPEEFIYVRRADAHKSTGVARLAIFPEDGKTSTLDFGPTPVISGQIVVDGSALVDTRLALSSPQSPYSGQFKAFATTDTGGNFRFAGAVEGRFSVYYQTKDRRRSWVRIETIDIEGKDMDLGVIPKQTATVYVDVINSNNNPDWQISTVYLQDGTRLFSPKVGTVEVPDDKGQPFVINNVPPGKYTLGVTRSDNTMLHKQVDIKPDTPQVEIEFTIPLATASVSGRITGETRNLILWRNDNALMNIITADNDGAYKINSLLPGSYSMGIYQYPEPKTVMTFDLVQGESKVVNVDTDEFVQPTMAMLKVVAVDGNGIPLATAELWLDGGDGEIKPLTTLTDGTLFATQPGTYILNAYHAGYEYIQQTVELTLIDPAEISKSMRTIYLRMKE